MAINYLEELNIPGVLALLFLHQAERRKVLRDLEITPEVLGAWKEYQELFRARLHNLSKEKTHYLLFFSHPQSSEEIDPFDGEEVRTLRERFDPLIVELVKHVDGSWMRGG